MPSRKVFPKVWGFCNALSRGNTEQDMPAPVRLKEVQRGAPSLFGNRCCFTPVSWSWVVSLAFNSQTVFPVPSIPGKQSYRRFCYDNKHIYMNDTWCQAKEKTFSFSFLRQQSYFSFVIIIGSLTTLIALSKVNSY